MSMPHLLAEAARHTVLGIAAREVRCARTVTCHSYCRRSIVIAIGSKQLDARSMEGEGATQWEWVALETNTQQGFWILHLVDAPAALALWHLVT